MTKASAARIARRRGRPSRDYSDDPDVAIAEIAIALEVAWGFSERRAIDLALVACQGTPGPPSKTPRGVKAGMWRGGSVALPEQQSFHGRNRDIRRKLKSGKLQPDAEIVRAMARLLHRVRTRRV